MGKYAGTHPPEWGLEFAIVSGSVLDVDDGAVTVHGTWSSASGSLCAIFTAVVPGHTSDIPPNPWHDSSLTLTPHFPQTTGNSGIWGPCIARNARGNCLPDTVFAWAFFQGDATAAPAVLQFYGDSEGTGCSGSGSGSGSFGAPAKLSSIVMPRFYRLTPNVTSMGLSGPAKNFLVGGGFFQDGIILEYDEDHSTPDAMIWRNLELPAIGTKWALRASQGAIRLEAVVTMQRGGESTVQTPFVWRCNSWKPTGKSILHCDINAVGFGLPSIYLEPVE